LAKVLSASLPTIQKEASPIATDDTALMNQQPVPLTRSRASKSFRIIGLVIIAGKFKNIQKYSIQLAAGPSVLR
jgi:hypothetical protein